MEKTNKEEHLVVQIPDCETDLPLPKEQTDGPSNDEIELPAAHEEIEVPPQEGEGLPPNEDIELPPDNEIEDCLEDSDSEVIGPHRPWNHFRWLQLDTSVRFNLVGTDWSPRIEIEAIPSGRTFHHKTNVKREEKSGRLVPDQKLFMLLNSRDQPLLALDYSTDYKSFHVMEPGSQRFIAFFTLPLYPFEEGSNSSSCTINIHNVIDDEIYVIDSLSPHDLSIPIKSANGEEMAVIMRPPPKWTASQPGLMTLHFTGDEREGLTCRERAIILGLFLALGFQGMTHWKRSTVGILTVYLLSALLGAFMVLVIYIAFRNDAVIITKHKITPGKFIPA